MIPDKIVIHHSGTSDGPENNTAGIRRWHMGTPPNGPKDGPYKDVAYHALCEKVGGSYENLFGRPWDKSGAHCLGHNGHTLGFCFVGDFTQQAPPLEQVDCGAKNLAYWMRAFRIPLENIVAHKDLNDTDCPGEFFPMAYLKMKIQEI